MPTDPLLLKDKHLCNSSNIAQKVELLRQKRREGKIVKYAIDKNSWISLYNPDAGEYYMFNPNSFREDHESVVLKNNKTLVQIHKELKTKYGKNWTRYLPKIKSI